MIILADKPGQLGNRLLVFANVIAATLTEGTITVANPSFDEYANFFQSTKDDLFCRYPQRRSFWPRSLPVRRLAYLLTLRWTSVLHRLKVHTRRIGVRRLEWGHTLNLADDKFYLQRRSLFFLQGWLIRDVHGLIKYQPQIKAFFQLRPEWQVEVSSIASRLREGVDILVGVHIRRGDYNERLGRRYFLELPEYASLVGQVERLFAPATVRFLISSDESVELNVGPKTRTERAPGHPAKDLYLLAECDYLLGPPSSFGFWASYIGSVPMCAVTDSVRRIAISDFMVFPEVVDSTVRELYLGTT